MLGFAGRDDPSRWSLAQWIAWRDAQINRILSPTFDAGAEKILSRDEVISRSAEAYDVLTPMLRDPAFMQDAGHRKELGNFVRFVTAQQRMAVPQGAAVSPNALDMDITDRQYLGFIAPNVQFPDLLRSQEFLHLMKKPDGYREAVRMIEAQNATLPGEKKWVVQPFRAQFIKSVDKTTYGRMLVLVPNVRSASGKILDRWILFAIATPDMEAPEELSVSMIATVRDPAKPGTHKAYAADFLRIQNPQTERIDILPNYLFNLNPSKNCYDCHKTGVLPIFPKTVYRFGPDGRLVADPAGAKGLTSMSERLVQMYGKTDWVHMDSGDFGPALGDSRDRSDAFVLEATSGLDLPSASIPKIREAMNCVRCHGDLVKIDYPLAVRTDRDIKSFETKKGMVQTYVESGLMPPNNTLSSAERQGLWRCLMKEYFDSSTQAGSFVEWLRGE